MAAWYLASRGVAAWLPRTILLTCDPTCDGLQHCVGPDKTQAACCNSATKCAAVCTGTQRICSGCCTHYCGRYNCLSRKLRPHAWCRVWTMSVTRSVTRRQGVMCLTIGTATQHCQDIIGILSKLILPHRVLCRVGSHSRCSSRRVA